MPGQDPTFRVLIDDLFPAEVAEVANQVKVESAELAAVASDDRDTEAAEDPTATASKSLDPADPEAGQRHRRRR